MAAKRVAKLGRKRQAIAALLTKLNELMVVQGVYGPKTITLDQDLIWDLAQIAKRLTQKNYVFPVERACRE